MGLVQTRDFKTVLSGSHLGTKIYPNINNNHMNQLPSNISYNYAMATIKWTFHFPGVAASSATYGSICSELVYFFEPASANWVYMHSPMNTYAGLVTGVMQTIGPGYIGLDITTINQTTPKLWFAFIEGKTSYYNGI